MLSRRACLAIVGGVSSALTVALYLAPRVPLGASYHYFVDQRSLLGVPNGLDVLSNIPFVLVGLCGMLFAARKNAYRSFLENSERVPYFIFFAGVFLAGFGSGYYHVAPGNLRLIWDLLPMTLSFVSITDATLIERIGTKIGLVLLLPLLVLGAASVVYWYCGEMRGHGDLRFYLFVQFFPPVAIAMLVTLFPPRYTRTIDLFIAFTLFVLAKICELLDKQIYSLGGVVSGHALKHAIAAFSCFWILRMLCLRRPAGNLHAETVA
jgi:hypothetical protein